MRPTTLGAALGSISHKPIMLRKRHGVDLRFIQSGEPSQNAFIERFNDSYRTDVLNNWLFTSFDETLEITHRRLLSYNEEQPGGRVSLCFVSQNFSN
jgi:transposase InsO family protein